MDIGNNQKDVMNRSQKNHVPRLAFLSSEYKVWPIDGHASLGLELGLGDHPDDEHGEDGQDDSIRVVKHTQRGQGRVLLRCVVGFVTESAEKKM